MHPGEATTRTVVPPAQPLVALPGAAAPDAGRSLNRVRWAVCGTLLVVLAFAAFRLWFVEGLLRHVTIDGPSMAPALFGPRYAVTCGDCGFPFACDAEDPPHDGLVVCPNCGYAKNELAPALLQPAERVLIDRWRLTWRAVGRGEVVAAQLPGGELVVKRVAGLAGERLSIHGGDLFANGQPIRKSPAELQQLRVLVHDNDYQPRATPNLPARWQVKPNSSSWQRAGTGFAMDEVDADDESSETGEIDWLEYQHWSGTGHPHRPRTTATAIEDLDAFNQGQTRRPLNRVSDVLLSCRLRLTGKGQVAFAAVDSGQRFEAIIEPGVRLVVTSEGQTLLVRRLRFDSFAHAADVQFGLCDGQVLLAIESRTLVQLPYERLATAKTSGSSAPLAIGASGGGVELTRLKVWRDIYYLEPHNMAADWKPAEPLDFESVALFGDNPPVSTDSRQWKPAGVPTRSMLGRVYRPFWSTR